MDETNTINESDVVFVSERTEEGVQEQISELVHNLEMKTNEIAQLKMELKRYKENMIPMTSATYCDDEKQMLLEANVSPNAHDVTDFAQNFLPNAKNECAGTENLADVLECMLPSACDWDKQSNSSISEMSVACLQDRILQMEETHYSTNEELQATLQELTDLQDQLTELQAENEHMGEEKAVLLESLCSQTEKLEDCRSEIGNLRQLLFTQDDQNGALSSSERETKLLQLLKFSRDEKEVLETQLCDLRSTTENVKDEAHGYHQDIMTLQEEILTLQTSLENCNATKRSLEKQSSESREQLDNLQIEVSRTKTQLENERIKVSELHQAREIVDKSELDELLDNARKEKDVLEAHAALLNEQVAFSQCEATRLKESMASLQEELEVTKNNTKKDMAELSYENDQLHADKDKLLIEIESHRESIHDLERKCQRHLEDKRELRATICDLKRKVTEECDKVIGLDKRVEEILNDHQSEKQEWKQFENDLLMTVRVANDFKAEAQEALESLTLDNKHLREKITNLHTELEKYKIKQRRATRAASCNENMITAGMDQAMSLPQNLSARRDSRPLSVKSLIESIECAAKQAKAQNSVNDKQTSITDKISQSESDDVDTGFESFKSRKEIANGSPEILTDKYNNKLTTPNKSSPELKSKRNTDAPLVSNSVQENDGVKHSSPISILTNKLDPLRRGSYSDILDRKDPLASLVKGGGSKRNALLKWCQNKTVGYNGIDITNFSSSWNDGLAFCALLHTYLSVKIPYDSLDVKDKRRNFSVAFKAAESVGIQCNLNINDMITTERPDWQAVMTYVTAIYKHFET